MHLIATDSGPIEEPFEMPELLLTPGERAEVLVRGERPPGRYRLMSMPYGRFNIGMMGRRGMMGGRPMGSEEPVVLGIRQTNPPR
jgi:FtsP/CotA-like multicopper oxidase with cupredoxin domain